MRRASARLPERQGGAVQPLLVSFVPEIVRADPSDPESVRAVVDELAAVNNSSSLEALQRALQVACDWYARPKVVDAALNAAMRWCYPRNVDPVTLARAGSVVVAYVEPLVSCLHSNLDSPAVQVAGLGAVVRFAHLLQGVFRQPFVERSGVQWLVQCMRRYQDNALLQQEACRAILNLVAYSLVNKSVVGNHEGIECVLSAMRRHAGSVTVQQKGCLALFNLVLRCPVNRERFYALGGIEQVLATMRLHRHVARIQEEACSLLAKMIDCGGDGQSVSRRYASRLVQSCGIEAFRDSIHLHPQDAGVVEWGCHAIRALVCAEMEQQVAQKRPLRTFPSFSQRAILLIGLVQMRRGGGAGRVDDDGAGATSTAVGSLLFSPLFDANCLRIVFEMAEDVLQRVRNVNVVSALMEAKRIQANKELQTLLERCGIVEELGPMERLNLVP